MFRWFEKRIDPYPEQGFSQIPRTLGWFIWQSTTGSRLWVVVTGLAAALYGVFDAWLYFAMGKVVDWLSNTSPENFWSVHGGHLISFAVLLFLSILLLAINAAGKYQGLMSNFPMRLRWLFHRRILDQDMSFFQDEFSGRVSAKVMQTSLAVRDVVVMFTDIAVYVLVTFSSILFLMATFNRYFFITFVVWLLCYIATLFYFVPRLGHVGKMQADARSLMVGRVTDAYSNIATVKLFGHSQRELTYTREAMQDFIGTAYRQMRLVSYFEVWNHILGVTLIIVTAFLALYLWHTQLISVGVVAAALALSVRLNAVSHWVMWEFSGLFENIGVVQDGISTLSKPVQVVDRTDPNEALKVQRGGIEFRDVSFGYGQQCLVIEHLNLSIKPGEKIGLVGRSGAGKSTIVSLLLRFYDVESGNILIDDQDISYVTQHSLRSHIGMVTQDTSLLHRSVRDNLLYGRPDASEAHMIAAAKQAEAHDFILGLEDAKGRRGYDVHVGERGIKLSGGQRQRLAIARVVLKNAPILILDEATSALDSEVEVAIQSSLLQLMEGKTVVAIAHRLSTIAAMDRLIVLDQGRIVEEGSHKELLARRGIYARLWAHQSGGFLGEG